MEKFPANAATCFPPERVGKILARFEDVKGLERLAVVSYKFSVGSPVRFARVGSGRTRHLMARFDHALWESGARYEEPEDLNLIHPTSMRKLSTFLENPFNDPNISLAELLAFSTDHLQKMIANNPGGVFTARIAATGTALTAVENTATDDLTKLGLRKARKQAKNAFRKALPGSIGKLAAAVEAKFGPKAPETAQCLPQGRTVFSDCTNDTVANHLQTLVNGVTALQAQLGAPVVTEATGLLTAWTAVYTTSESSGGAKRSPEAARKSARENLQLEWFKNLLTLALNFPRQPEQLGLYMQQGLLEDHPIKPAALAPPPGP